MWYLKGSIVHAYWNKQFWLILMYMATSTHIVYSCNNHSSWRTRWMFKLSYTSGHCVSFTVSAVKYFRCTLKHELITCQMYCNGDYSLGNQSSYAYCLHKRFMRFTSRHINSSCPCHLIIYVCPSPCIVLSVPHYKRGGIHVPREICWNKICCYLFSNLIGH